MNTQRKDWPRKDNEKIMFNIGEAIIVTLRNDI